MTMKHGCASCGAMVHITVNDVAAECFLCPACGDIAVIDIEKVQDDGMPDEIPEEHR